MASAEETLGLATITVELTGLIIMATAIRTKHTVAIGPRDPPFLRKSADLLGNVTHDLTQGFHLGHHLQTTQSTGEEDLMGRGRNGRSTGIVIAFYQEAEAEVVVMGVLHPEMLILIFPAMVLTPEEEKIVPGMSVGDGTIEMIAGTIEIGIGWIMMTGVVMDERGAGVGAQSETVSETGFASEIRSAGIVTFIAVRQSL